MKSRFFSLLSAALALLVSAPTLVQAATPAKLHLNNGKVLEGTVRSIGAESIQWQTKGTSSTVAMGLSNFKWAEFETDSDWIDAEEAFEHRDYQTALELYQSIAKQKSLSRGYPLVGNLATLAHRRSLDCFQKLRQAYEVNIALRDLEQDMLAPEHKVTPLLHAWAAAGKKVPDPAITKITDIINGLPKGSPEALELYWLRGHMHLLKEDTSMALKDLCRVFTINAGSDRDLGIVAMQDAIKILAALPGKGAETKAMLELYQTNYGRGELWADASPNLHDIVKGEFQTDSKVEFFGSTPSSSGSAASDDAGSAQGMK